VDDGNPRNKEDSIPRTNTAPDLNSQNTVPARQIKPPVLPLDLANSILPAEVLLEIQTLGLLVVNAFTFDSKIELIKSAINEDVKKLRLEAHLEMAIRNELLTVGVLIIVESMNYLALEVLASHEIHNSRV